MKGRSMIRNAVKYMHEEANPFIMWMDIDEHFPTGGDIWSAYPKTVRKLVHQAVNEHLYEIPDQPAMNANNRQRPRPNRNLNIYNKMAYYRKHPDKQSQPLQYSNITKPTNSYNYPIKLYNHALHARPLKVEVSAIRNPNKSTRYYFIHSKTHLTESKFNSISTRLQMHSSYYWNTIQQMRMRNYFIGKVNERGGYEAAICTKCNQQAQCTAYHRMVECEGEDDARTRAMMATKQKMKSLEMTKHIEAMTEEHPKQKTRLDNLKTKLNRKYPSLHQHPIWPDELEIVNINEKGRLFGIIIDEEYNHITKKKGDDRDAQITRLHTKMEKMFEKHPLCKFGYDQDSIEIITDIDHITYYLTLKEFQNNELGLKIINDYNDSNINNTLRQLIMFEEDLYKLIAPDPTTNSTFTQTILYCLAYYIVWFTNDIRR